MCVCVFMCGVVVAVVLSGVGVRVVEGVLVCAVVRVFVFVFVFGFVCGLCVWSVVCVVARV